MTGYGSMTVYCAEAARAETEAVLKKVGHSWDLYREPFGDGHRLKFVVPIHVKVEEGKAVPA